MSQAKKKRSKLELGHDAFLDIVANLVGILIILVVVLGTQSTAVIQEIQEQTNEEVSPEGNTDASEFASREQLAELAQHSMRAASAQADSNRLEKTVKRYDAMIAVRNDQRAGLMDLLGKAQEVWEEKKHTLAKEKTESARLNAQFEQAEKKLAVLKGERQRLENEPEQVIAVAHLPTPMARTVFGDELHFRLKDNRLSVVPVEKLMDEIRRDLQRAVPGSRSGLLESSVGPLRGYVARYAMSKGKELVSRDGRVGTATRLQVLGMTFEPLEEPYGQPIAQVLAGSSELDIELAGRDPGSTSITVWVYPDSFASFRQLKEHLYARGFATAGRPLEPGRAITASPNGTRSQAQ